MSTRLTLTLLFFTWILTAPVKADGVEGLVGKLFEILESRHREILSVEENITHNRSEMERESLVRILEGKIREFLRKDKQVFAVLEQIKSSKDSAKMLLYRTSLSRLERFRQTIQEIQNLYFTRPLVLSPPLQVQTGTGNFGTFLSSWEKDTTPKNYEKRTQREVIPATDQNYYDHMRSQDRKDTAPADTYQKFLTKLNPLPASKREVLEQKDRAPLDKYHSRLSRESKTPFQLSRKDGSFQAFYKNLENSFHDEREVKKSQVAMPASTSPFDVPGDYYTKLDTPEPKRPLDLLMDDLDRMRHIKTGGKSSSNQARSSRSFRRFFDQLELSKQQKESLMDEVGTALHSKESLENIAGKVRQEAKKDAPDPVDEKGEVKQSFHDFHKALVEPDGVLDDPGLYQSDPGTTRNKGDFQAFLNQIPTSKAPSSNQTPTAFSHDWIGSDVETGTGASSKNRFRAILKVLKKDNQIAAMEREFVDPDEKKFESELRSVFPEKRVETKKTKSIMVPVEGPRFDSFPGNVVQAAPVEQVLAAPRLAHSAISEISGKPLLGSRSTASSLDRAETPLSSNTGVQSAPGSSFTTVESSPHLKYSGLLPEPDVRQSRATEARLLSRGATLIPIEIEARDVKDRVYPDVDISFEVELSPKNFLAGHILESFEDDAWRKTVKTDPNGMARIHLLLDLQEHEVNISRKIETTKEKTVCKILITPRI